MNILKGYRDNISVSEIAKLNKMTYKECQEQITKELASLYEGGMSIKGIARNFNKDKCTISVRLKPYITKRVLKSDKRLSKIDKQEIIKKYVVEGKLILTISEELGFTVGTISNFIKRQNLKQPAYIKSEKISSNIRLFNTQSLSSAESYILGFFTGDGHLSKQNSIQFHNTDEDIILKLHKYLPDFNFSIKQTGFKPLFSLVKTDFFYVKKFKSFGIDNQKSYTVRFPKELQMEFSSYLRGLFDSDGHISKQSTSNGIQIGFTSGSKEFLEDIIYQISKHLPSISKHTVSKGVNKTATWYQLKYSGKNAKIILEFIYQYKSNLFMNRKYEKYKLLVGS